MSYGMSPVLQTAIYEALRADAALAGLVGAHIYDALPTGAVPETYVSIGDERVRDASDQTHNGSVHKLDILVRTTQPGFAKAKAIAAIISDALHNAQLSMSRGRMVSLQFERATARRIETNTAREILLLFRARLDDE